MNSVTAVQLICRLGHECSPRPASLAAGQGPCRACAGKDPAHAEARFWERVAELGATPAEGAVYVNTTTRVALTCRRGHACAPTPKTVLRGQGPCLACGGRDPRSAEAAFWARIAELGAKPEDGATYTNNNTKVPLICKEGHRCSPWPLSVLAGKGICSTCAGVNPLVVEARFWEQVGTLGAVPAPGCVYVNAHTPVTLLCINGHLCTPVPSQTLAGVGICGQCRVRFDRVYLLQHFPAGAIKVGIASSKLRVAAHVTRGYSPVAEWWNLEHRAACTAERTTLQFWRSNGWAEVPAAPRDGRSETTSRAHLEETFRYITGELGAPTVATLSGFVTSAECMRRP